MAGWMLGPISIGLNIAVIFLSADVNPCASAAVTAGEV